MAETPDDLAQAATGQGYDPDWMDDDEPDDSVEPGDDDTATEPPAAEETP